MSSKDDTAKPAKTFGRPMGGVSMFGANPGLMNEMKHRLKKPNDPEEGTEPETCDDSKPVESGSSYLLPNRKSPSSSNSATVTSLRKGRSSENVSESAVGRRGDQPPAASTRSSRNGDDVLSGGRSPRSSLTRQSNVSQAFTKTKNIDETGVVHRAHDKKQIGENRLSHPNEHRARRPPTGLPTVYRFPKSTRTSDAVEDVPDQDEQPSSPTSCSGGGNRESGGNHLDNFFGSCSIDG